MRIYGQTRTTTDKELVEFLNSQQAKEGVFLEQRLRAVENQTVLLATQTVDGQSVTDSPLNPSSSNDADQSKSPEATTEQLSNIEIEAVVTETPEYYGEF